MQPFHPVSSSKLYIQIYNQIRGAIAAGIYKPGDKLPSEKEFCQMFSVSRVPVREALCALELNGLVESSQGMGVYVKDVHAVTNDWTRDIDPQDIIQSRKMIEPEVARCAALNIDEAEKERLRAVMARFRQESDADDYPEAADREFHMSLARASGNHLMPAFYDMIWKAMRQDLWSVILRRTVFARQIRQQHLEEHARVAQAVLDGDAEQAYNSMRFHFLEFERRYWSDLNEGETKT